MGYPVAIFDVDGTLLDTTEGIVSSVQYVIETEGLGHLDQATLRTFIGPPMQDSFSRVYGFEPKEALRLADIFRNYYKEEALYRAVPYEGIFALCDELSSRGVRIGVATYKRQDYAQDILRHFGFDKYSSFLYGADFEGKMKKVDIIEKCLKDMGVARYSTALMIGDSSHDALGASLIGVDFLGVTYGFGFKTMQDVELYPFVGVAKAPAEILDYF